MIIKCITVQEAVVAGYLQVTVMVAKGGLVDLVQCAVEEKESSPLAQFSLNAIQNSRLFQLT